MTGMNAYGGVWPMLSLYLDKRPLEVHIRVEIAIRRTRLDDAYGHGTPQGLENKSGDSKKAYTHMMATGRC
jgi:hypothetical protein